MNVFPSMTLLFSFVQIFETSACNLCSEHARPLHSYAWTVWNGQQFHTLNLNTGRSDESPLLLLVDVGAQTHSSHTHWIMRAHFELPTSSSTSSLPLGCARDRYDLSWLAASHFYCSNFDSSHLGSSLQVWCRCSRPCTLSGHTPRTPANPHNVAVGL